MAIIRWNEELSVGVELFDSQHRELFSRLNQLHDAMAKGDTKAVMGSILDELVRYTGYHFESEEKAFDQFSYPEAEAHKAEHRDFARKAAELKEKFDSGKLLISVETLNFLIRWVDSHIKGSDKKYTAALQGKI